MQRLFPTFLVIIPHRARDVSYCAVDAGRQSADPHLSVLFTEALSVFLSRHLFV